MSDLIWTEDQWQQVHGAVSDSFNKASIARSFLPMYGPLPGGTEVVRNEQILVKDTNTIAIDKNHDQVNRRLVNLTVKVELTSEQVADESLSTASLVFQRAGSILAQEQDRIVFSGYKRGFEEENSRFVANPEIEAQRGLADLITRVTDFDSKTLPAKDTDNTLGQSVVSAVVRTMARLEESSNPAPFVCVLGNGLYEAVHDPSASLVLPADRVTPLLSGGQLLRTGKVEAGTGILVSLAGGVIDLVVGRQPTVQFLQRNEDAKYLFRVYMRLALRIRDAQNPPVAGFRFITTDTKKREQSRYTDIT